MTTGIYKVQKAYRKNDTDKREFTKALARHELSRQLTAAKGDGRHYHEQPFYLPLPDGDKITARFEVGALLTVAQWEAEVGELVASSDMPPCERDYQTIAAAIGEQLRLLEFDEISPQPSALFLELREFKKRYYGPEFLKITAWERIK